MQDHHLTQGNLEIGGQMLTCIRSTMTFTTNRKDIDQCRQWIKCALRQLGQQYTLSQM